MLLFDFGAGIVGIIFISFYTVLSHIFCFISPYTLHPISTSDNSRAAAKYLPFEKQNKQKRALESRTCGETVFNVLLVCVYIYIRQGGKQVGMTGAFSAWFCLFSWRLEVNGHELCFVASF